MNGLDEGVVAVTVLAGGGITLACDVDDQPPPSPEGWSVAAGTASSERGRGLSVDAEGNVFVIGVSNAMPELDLGGGLLDGNTSNFDIFVAKFAHDDGTHLWSRSFGGVNLDDGTDIAVDDDGNIIVAGFFDTSVDFGGGVLNSPGAQKDVFVAKLSGADGSHIWSTQFAEIPRGSIVEIRQVRVDVDSAGDVFVLGNFDDAIDLGDGPVTSVGGTDFFVAKLTGSSGERIWSQALGFVGDDFASDLAINSVGDVFVSGVVEINAAGDRKVPLWWFAGADGTYALSLFDALGDTKATAIAVDENDNVIIAGSFQGSLSFGGGPALNNTGGPGDIFLAKFDSTRGHVFSQSFAGPLVLENAWDVTVDGNSNILVIGRFGVDINFGPLTLTTAGMDDLFLAKFDSSGNFVAAQQIGSPENDQGWAVEVGPDGAPVVTGLFSGTTTIGPSLTSNGSADFLLVKLPFE